LRSIDVSAVRARSAMLNTRVVMVASSVVLLIGAVVCLFLPTEALATLGFPAENAVVGQMIGALYLGFAAANWTARGSMIGGIYARPLSVANFVHFVVGGTVLAKGITDSTLNFAYLTVTLGYAIFAVLFVLVFYGRLERFRNPESSRR
jgi:hypothetical protein